MSGHHPACQWHGHPLRHEIRPSPNCCLPHHPLCFVSDPVTIDRPGLCICERLHKAWRDGYNAHATSAQEWRDTHGAYTQHGAGENP